jgi:hypothetical protein
MRQALLVLLLLSVLSGCADLIHGHSRTLFGVDCRPDKLRNGQCVETRAPGGV